MYHLITYPIMYIDSHDRKPPASLSANYSLTCPVWCISLLLSQDEPGESHAVSVHRLHGLLSTAYVYETGSSVLQIAKYLF